MDKMMIKMAEEIVGKLIEELGADVAIQALQSEGGHQLVAHEIGEWLKRQEALTIHAQMHPKQFAAAVLDILKPR